jgi:hypothetical protein
VTVWLGGRPVLVDPGFYCYNGDPAWEVHFRKTIAHNTVRIDGRDQAHHLAKMAWCRTYKATIGGWQSDAGGSFATGWHDGYNGEARGGVVHRRTVWLRPGGYVLIADELTGDGAHVAEWTYQFAPGAAALNGANGLTFDDRADLVWAASHPVSADLAEGGSRPDEGWIAPSLGVRVAAPRLRLRAELATGSLAVLSVLVDRAAGWRVSPYAGGTSGCLALSAEGRGVRDVVIAKTASKAEARGLLETDAPVAVYREQPGRDPELHRAGGSYVRSTPPGTAGDDPATSSREEPR